MMDAASVQPALVRDEALGILSRLGAPQSAFADEGVEALSPITGELIAHVRITSSEEVSAIIGRATQAFNAWRTVSVVSSCGFSLRNCARRRMISAG
jgi:aldehyde dehydrogenase (NAD+)